MLDDEKMEDASRRRDTNVHIQSFEKAEIGVCRMDRQRL